MLWAFALSLMLMAATPAQAQLQPVPKLTGHLVDGAGMLNAEQRTKLEAVLADYDARTGSQIAVLTVKSTEPEAIEQFSIRVVEAWKLGRKGVDDGVLLMVAPNNPTALRRLRIEAGRGVQGSLTDAQSKRVLQDVIAPQFRDKNYYEGLVAGVGAIATLLNAEQFPAPVQAQEQHGSSSNSGSGLPIGALLAVAVGFMILRAVFGGRGRGASLGRGGWGSGATGFVIGSILSNAGNGGGGGSGGGGGGFGGGGFSGGGGSFDGGGASGDW
ncbi:MAG: TPM domain-containing protein [Pseudomonadota bacterium]|nr:TPM domain-containing protein [Pseudomonadota bacterium]